ncbi:MAG TPA: hypothetical protein PKE38_14650 [Ignavibacteriaceae bacterium]|nr:hypothetical protein [Ignavibacterium sp.]HMN25741.1 hypothetical protein [Ignavibacteriaceae bacterium]
MIPEIRKKFNNDFSEKVYHDFLDDLNSILKYPTGFRVCETPLFLSHELTNELIKACEDVISQIKTEEFIKRSEAAIPQHLKVPNDFDHPPFLQLDFAITKSEDRFLPKLIELQAFPSLYGFQVYLNETIRKYFDIPVGFNSYFSGLNKTAYRALLTKLIIGNCDPENVILLEIEPEKQKTRIDFAATEELTGVTTVCLSKIKKRGKKIFYSKDGREIQVKRIYNRVIFDELERKNLKFDFDFRDEIEAEWVGHPNWFFKISKFSLPMLKGNYVPDCYFLNELDKYPKNLNDFVLKPLFSFAGLGVDVDVTKEKLDAIAIRNNYILQQKVNYAPLLETPDGYSKTEIRMMFLWENKNEKPLLVNNLIRTSKGKMMGVDFNKNQTWIGSSIAYHP